MPEVKQITDYEEWDEFVESSPQGTIFSTARWCDLFNIPYSVYGYFRNDDLLGGIIGFEKDEGFYSGGIDTPLTPFQGVICLLPETLKQHSVIARKNELTEALITKLESKYKTIWITNHYTFPDIRPFIWKGYRQLIRYTQIIELNENTWTDMQSDVKRKITKAREDTFTVNGDLSKFDDMYNATFERKEMERPLSREFIEKLCKEFDTKIYLHKDAGAIVVCDSKRAYYLLGASSAGDYRASSLILWVMFEDLKSCGVKELDLVGCNDYNIALFKRGFGGKLLPYYGVSKVAIVY